MSPVHDAHLFSVVLDARPASYRIVYTAGSHEWRCEDPYRFSPVVGELDNYLIGEGNHHDLYRILGSHVVEHEGVAGVQFAVWAPNARSCTVIGPFNHWDDRAHPMRKHPGSGLWELFIPALEHGEHYKYALRDSEGRLLPYKTDPYARYFEAPPGNTSIVFESAYQWNDDQWQQQRQLTPDLAEPLSVYEVHLTSWRHDEEGKPYSYRELVKHLIPYAVDNGFTHLELLPITEHPFAGSWGYQPIGMFAPTHRLGSPDDLRFFIDSCHQQGLGVIMDWVPAHFPADEHGLGLFDGTHLYEHADPRLGRHMDWDTLIYNFGRNEVRNYLLCNALFWIEEFHLDGLRVDAVASMLYLDYSREEGEWLPNRYGGNHNIEAVEFLKQLNTLVHAAGAIAIAEESTSWDGVSRPVDAGGLGFTYKWNMGWMHDILDYMSQDPVHRKHHHNKLTFGLVYAHSEHFFLPFSHDEVVYGKQSLLSKMPGDRWQQLANLRCLYGLMFAYPGKKLLFMGSEFGQNREWSHDDDLEWSLLQFDEHQGLLQLVRELNSTYRREASLHAGDCDAAGFEWIDCDDAEQSVVSFYRRVPGHSEAVIAVCNFTPVTRENYRLGVFDAGNYREILNTDAASFGGSNILNDASLPSAPIAAMNKPHSIEMRLPPLATVYLQRY